MTETNKPKRASEDHLTLELIFLASFSSCAKVLHSTWLLNLRG